MVNIYLFDHDFVRCKICFIISHVPFMSPYWISYI